MPACACCNHEVLLYEDSHVLCARVAAEISGAIDAGGGAIVAATEEHIAGILACLWANHDVDELISGDRLCIVRADECLNRIMSGVTPQRDVFSRLVRGLIEKVRTRFNPLFVYGELVNVLWKQDNLAAAQQLEEWWNKLIAEYDFRLLCGYQADPFDPQVHEMVTSVCQTHSKLTPCEHDAHFSKAIDEAFRCHFPNANENLMKELANHFFAGQPHAIDMPHGQAALLGLSALMPSVAEQVRTDAQCTYGQWTARLGL